MAKKRFSKKGFDRQVHFKELVTDIGFSPVDLANSQEFISELLAHHGRETQRNIREMLSRRWTPGIAALRPFPAMRTGRLRDAIGYVVYRSGTTTTLATGVLIKVPLQRGQLPPGIWAVFQEYGHVVKMKDPQRPFFYVPTRNSPAMGADGQIDKDWLPGKPLREKLKRIGANLGARAFYFPVPESKSAKKRSIYIAAIRWEGGKANYVLKPTRIAVGLREFTIPARPFLREGWDRLYNQRGTGQLNRDMKKSIEELNTIMTGGLRGGTLGEYERRTVQVALKLSI